MRSGGAKLSRRGSRGRHAQTGAEARIRATNAAQDAESAAFVYAVYMPVRSTTAERILQAARALFERDGPEAVSMRRVADAVGLTPMAIYRHFPNRDALLKRISDDSFDAIARHWLARNQGGDVLSRVIALQRIYLDYALAHPHLFDHAFSTRRVDARRR